ncbi:MAG TPA: group 1 truncated hemoglobin [Pseudobdellovibrionaceae bacterium]|nr:group 1 truncated hemoglobin [Pseudobdellovibrionaceae bacterium]
MDYDQLKADILKVNKVFYDKVFKDPWLMLVFKDVKQDIIERQQTDFMIGAFGGPKVYSGRNPKDAHMHIFVNEEMWQLREKYLREAFEETRFPKDLADKWLRIDEAFKKTIMKSSLSECEKRFATDEIVFYPHPPTKKAA